MLSSFLKRLGYYYKATYRFSDWFEVGTYYSKFYPNADDRNGSEVVPGSLELLPNNYQAWLEDIAPSLRFDINDNWVCKLEGHRMDGAAFCLAIDNDDFDRD